MTVAELIKQLKDLPSDMKVLKAKDDEGNGFMPVGGAWDYWILQSVGHYEYDVYADEDYEDLDEEDKEKCKKVAIVW